jgi:predicted hotdog family 3-hydroxylacyl-ACP dehydratase
MATESGYSNQKKYGSSQYKTVQNVGSDKFGVNTAQMYLFDLTPSAIPVTNVEVDFNADKIPVVYLEVTSHGAREFDILRVTDNSSDLYGWEFEVIEVIDANTLAVYNIGYVNHVEEVIAIGDEVKICRWITAKADSEGALSTSSGPSQFMRNGALQTTTQDTAVPANNRPLPAGLYFYKDGIAVPVNKDTGVPANTAAVPVEIVGASGQTINISAGDINIHTTSEGATFDAMRIGDGSGVYLKVEADGSINTKDGKVQALTDAQLRATAVPVSAVQLPATLGQKTKAASLAVVLASDTDPLNVQPNTLEVSGTGSALNSTPIAATDVSKYRAAFVEITGSYTGTLSFQGSLDGATWTNILAQVVNSSSSVPTLAIASATGMFWIPLNFKFFRVLMSAYTSGTATGTALFTSMAPADLGTRLVNASQQGTWNITNISGVVSLPTGASTSALQTTGNTSLANVDGKLPATLGQKAMATSLAVTMASDQGAIPTAPAALTGTYQELLAITTSVQTITAPAGAKWCKIQADDNNTDNVRVKIGGVASATSGFQYQAGRSEDYKIAGNISVFAESANGVANKIYVQFGA